MNIRHILVSLITVAIIFVVAGPVTVIAKEGKVPLGAYEIIVKKDPFDPDRGQGEEEETPQDEAAAEEELSEQYQVYGTIIAGDMSQAFVKVVTDPKKSPRRRPRPGAKKKDEQALRTLTVGDMIDGWRVADITAQGIVLDGPEGRMELGIFDTPKNDRRATAPVALQTPRPKPPPTPRPTTTPPPVATRRPAPSGVASGVPAATPSPATTQPATATPKTQRPSVFGGPNIKPRATQARRAPAATQRTIPPAITTPPSRSSAGSGGTNPFLELLKQSQQNQ
jgi:hypothetical protein